MSLKAPGFAGIFFLLIFSVQNLKAASLVFADFDDTIVESRKERNGSFQGRYLIFKNVYRSSTLTPEADGDMVIEVSTAEFRELRHLMARGKNDPGVLAEEFELSNGQRIFPGEYEIRDPDTYLYFRPNPEAGGESYLVEAMKKALRNGGDKWQGLYWESMLQILNDPEAAQYFGIITSRGHDSEEWNEFFELLKKKGFIKHLPRTSQLFHDVSRREYDVLSLNANVPLQKMQLLERKARALKDVPLDPVKDLRLNADGDGLEVMHSLTFIEDKPETLVKVFELFRKLAMTNWLKTPIKFTLVLTSTEEEMQRLSRYFGYEIPRALVFTSKGTIRPASQEELTGELLSKATPGAFSVTSCRKALRY